MLRWRIGWSGNSTGGTGDVVYDANKIDEVSKTPLQPRMSDIIHVHLDEDQVTGYPVVEIKFKFVRYRLIMDDRQNAFALRSAIDEVLKLTRKGEEETKKLPPFYKGKPTKEVQNDRND